MKFCGQRCCGTCSRFRPKRYKCRLIPISTVYADFGTRCPDWKQSKRKDAE